MKPIFLVVTCRRDEALLPIWAQGVRRLVPDAILVAAVDAAEADMVLPKKIHRVITHFARNGNLNGLDAVIGILRLIAEIGEKFGGGPVIKLDSDTVLTGGNWLHLLDHTEYLGFEGGPPLVATGICYALHPTAARRILAASDPWPWQKNSKFPEDFTIFTLATLFCQTVLLPWSGGRWVQSFLPGHFGAPEIPLAAAAAVHCGQTEFLVTYDAALDRAAMVRRAMLCLLRAGKRAGLQS